MKPAFRLEVSYDDRTADPVAAYLRIREGTVAATKELSSGVAFADYGSDGFLLGVELLAPCEVKVLDQLAENEPDAVKKFLGQSVRQPLAFA